MELGTCYTYQLLDGKETIKGGDMYKNTYKADQMPIQEY